MLIFDALFHRTRVRLKTANGEGIMLHLASHDAPLRCAEAQRKRAMQKGFRRSMTTEDEKGVDGVSCCVIFSSTKSAVFYSSTAVYTLR